MNIIYAQIIGVIAVIVFNVSVQFKKKKNIMFMQLIANILFAVQYYLLNVITASIMNLITVFRIIFFYKYDKKNKSIPIILPIIFCLGIFIYGVLTYTNLLNIIPVIITMLYVIGAASKGTKTFTIIFGICGFIWIYYNYQVGAYTSIIGNTIEIISAFIALKRMRTK